MSTFSLARGAAALLALTGACLLARAEAQSSPENSAPASSRSPQGTAAIEVPQASRTIELLLDMKAAPPAQAGAGSPSAPQPDASKGSASAVPGLPLDTEISENDPAVSLRKALVDAWLAADQNASTNERKAIASDSAPRDVSAAAATEVRIEDAPTPLGWVRPGVEFVREYRNELLMVSAAMLALIWGLMAIVARVEVNGSKRRRKRRRIARLDPGAAISVEPIEHRHHSKSRTRRRESTRSGRRRQHPAGDPTAGTDGG